MSFVGLSRGEEQRMLATIGVARFEDLVAAVPEEVRLTRPLDVPGPLSEIEARQRFGERARANDGDRAVSFLGPLAPCGIWRDGPAGGPHSGWRSLPGSSLPRSSTGT